MKYHLTLLGTAIIKMSTNNKCWRGCGEKGTFLHYWWECKLVQPLWKIAWRFLKTLKLELLYDLAFPLLGIYLEKTKTNLKRHMHPMLIVTLFTIAKSWKQPKCPLIDDQFKLHPPSHTHNGVLLSHIKEWNIAICNRWT